MPNGKRLHPLIQAGMAFLVVASIAKWSLHPKSMPGRDVADAVIGLFYGLAIGCMLFGLYKSRQHKDTGATPNT